MRYGNDENAHFSASGRGGVIDNQIGQLFGLRNQW
jgi:hypothetical protein